MKNSYQNGAKMTEEKYNELAKEIGLKVKRFKKDLEKNSEAWDQVIVEDLKLGSKVAVRGTPTFYLNGKKTRSRTVEAFKSEIDAILAGGK